VTQRGENQRQHQGNNGVFLDDAPELAANLALSLGKDQALKTASFQPHN